MPPSRATTPRLGRQPDAAARALAGRVAAWHQPVMDQALCDALDTVWRLLDAAAADRRSPMHTPVVANSYHDIADSRIMVLRAVTRETATLRFHTDARSPKCAAIDGGALSVLAYHPGEAIQIRMSGRGHIICEGIAVDAIWSATPPFARRCYLAEAPPGTPLAVAASGLPDWIEGREPTEAELGPARANFAVLTVELTEIDWLHLAHSGHRRALFRAADGWAGGWVVP